MSMVYSNAKDLKFGNKLIYEIIIKFNTLYSINKHLLIFAFLPNWVKQF